MYFVSYVCSGKESWNEFRKSSRKSSSGGRFGVQALRKAWCEWCRRAHHASCQAGCATMRVCNPYIYLFIIIYSVRINV